MDACDDLITDEKLDEYANLEDGKDAACKEVDCRAMKQVLAAKKIKTNSTKKYVWDLDDGEGTTGKSAIETAISNVAD